MLIANLSTRHLSPWLFRGLDGQVRVFMVMEKGNRSERSKGKTFEADWDSPDPLGEAKEGGTDDGVFDTYALPTFSLRLRRPSAFMNHLAPYSGTFQNFLQAFL